MASFSVATQDKNAPTLPGAVVRAQAAYFVESSDATASDTYTADFFIPAFATILDIRVYAQALWTDTTAASLEVGDYTTAATPVAIDADGWYAAINLKATDLLAGQSMSILKAGEAADEGVYLDTTAYHNLQDMDEVDRWIRAKVTVTAGDGTAGRTMVTVFYAAPEVVQINPDSV